MGDPALVARRTLAQGLVTRPFADPHEAVAFHGAMQGQDLPGVISSIALRLAGEDRDPSTAVGRVLADFDAGRIVRGYPMRGTVFAVAAEDLAWMTQLCADGPVQAAIRRRPRLGLEDCHVATARRVLERRAGGSDDGVDRAELFAAWDEAGVSPAGGRGYHLLVHFISTLVAAYGPCDGVDHRVVLTQEWLPAGSRLEERFDGDRTAAAAELLRRYLISHGPATLRDASWWTKLPLRLLRTALEQIRDDLAPWTPDARGEERFCRPGLEEETLARGAEPNALFLLPGFDEIVLGTPDRTDLLAGDHHELLVPGNNGMFQKGVLRRGRMIGTWRREGAAGRRRLRVDPFGRWPAVAQREAERAFASFPHPRP